MSSQQITVLVLMMVAVLASTAVKQICPDKAQVCLKTNTCCLMRDEVRYGCCPFPNAVCCSDHVHCCPKGMACNSANLTCDPAVTSPLLQLLNLLEPRPYHPPQAMLESEESLLPPKKAKFVSGVSIPAVFLNSTSFMHICPDSSACPDLMTCCPLSNGSYGCCPMNEGVCCPDHLTCCPAHTKCGPNHSCRKD